MQVVKIEFLQYLCAELAPSVSFLSNVDDIRKHRCLCHPQRRFGLVILSAPAPGHRRTQTCGSRCRAAVAQPLGCGRSDVEGHTAFQAGIVVDLGFMALALVSTIIAPLPVKAIFQQYLQNRVLFVSWWPFAQ